MAAEATFSRFWFFISIGIYFASEVLIGHVLGNVLAGSWLSMPGNFRIQGLLYLGSYFIGGFVVGLVSPGIRTVEPALAAAASAAMGLIVAIFVPNIFMRFTMMRLVLACVAAFVIANWGARFGEKISGNDPDQA